jgi:synaptobrevin family protein YKT6
MIPLVHHDCQDKPLGHLFIIIVAPPFFSTFNMKLFAVTICARREATGETILLCSEHELSTFGFFQRGRQVNHVFNVSTLLTDFHSIREFMNFFAKTISERTELGQRQSVEKEGK